MTSTLDIQALSLTLGGKDVLKDVRLTVSQGEIVILLGPNGAGKSTLLRTVLGLHSSMRGRVQWRGESLGEMDAVTRAAHLSWLPQHGVVTEPLSVLELVTSARFRFQESHADARAAAALALAELDMADFGSRTLDTLSGGETQKVALAALLAQDATAFLLDEPGNHLDPRHQFELYQWIGRQWESGRTVVCTTHDIGLLGHIGTSERLQAVRVVGMERGGIAFDTTYGDPTLSQHLERLFRVPFFSVEVGGHLQWIAGTTSGEQS